MKIHICKLSNKNVLDSDRKACKCESGRCSTLWTSRGEFVRFDLIIEINEYLDEYDTYLLNILLMNHFLKVFLELNSDYTVMQAKILQMHIMAYEKNINKHERIENECSSLISTALYPQLRQTPKNYGSCISTTLIMETF